MSCCWGAIAVRNLLSDELDLNLQWLINAKFVYVGMCLIRHESNEGFAEEYEMKTLLLLSNICF